MGALKPWHIIVLVVVLLLLFGAKRLPDAARGLGRSLRIFKSEVKEMQNDDDDVAERDTTWNPKAIDEGRVNGTDPHVNGSRSSEAPSASRER
ncbi:Sec-independent protein translocase subunit TatA [Paenibacillus sp. TRM 82003]|uniref:Sec-independent protein translocase subunit TatA n=1 Tax=Kineococcus sp. TRM81007 TaxID=2925831 RepID=UPI001F561700|nr:Sec-independent protein translocase subunit TatA [Kineococcus sp. TRM81007]MCI2237722.1 Sec-independent protein translocase subunit TatA [Kineococcus sp. TRM81007]MCI3921740.1 Sec-independent protein translocase subunit TatA [Paenibacillus sp. TRM 82003]